MRCACGSPPETKEGRPTDDQRCTDCCRLCSKIRRRCRHRVLRDRLPCWSRSTQAARVESCATLQPKASPVILGLLRDLLSYRQWSEVLRSRIGRTHLLSTGPTIDSERATPEAAGRCSRGTICVLLASLELAEHHGDREKSPVRAQLRAQPTSGAAGSTLSRWRTVRALVRGSTGFPPRAGFAWSVQSKVLFQSMLSKFICSATRENSPSRARP